jgi:hypothetical protein
MHHKLDLYTVTHALIFVMVISLLSGGLIGFILGYQMGSQYATQKTH